jgi:hypothetical protein
MRPSTDKIGLCAGVPDAATETIIELLHVYFPSFIMATYG